MTAYGKAQFQGEVGDWSLEIYSVNRKGLDIQVHVDNSLLFLDPLIRKLLKETTERGTITIRVHIEMARLENMINDLKKLKVKWEMIAKCLELSDCEITLPFLLSCYIPQWNIQEAAVLSEFQIVWKQACEKWLNMKQIEANFLCSDIQHRLQSILEKLRQIQEISPVIKQQYRQKLESQLYQCPFEIDQNRLLQELIFLVEKSDFTEELTRLKAHIHQFYRYLESPETSIGRTLDFLCQEMNREAHTLTVKASHQQVSELSIWIKSEIEKIREQVQNIE